MTELRSDEIREAAAAGIPVGSIMPEQYVGRFVRDDDGWHFSGHVSGILVSGLRLSPLTSNALDAVIAYYLSVDEPA